MVDILFGPNPQGESILPEPYDALTDIYGGESDFWQHALRYPSNEAAISNFHHELYSRREQGHVIGMVAGVFDIFHANHEWYLIQVKTQLIAETLLRNGCPPAEITPDLIKQEMVEPEKYILVVSVDGNDQVSASKGGRPEKGGIPKPVFDWSKRARDVAGVTVPHPQNPSQRTPVATYVTSHDFLQFPNSVHASDLALGAHIQPDVWFTIAEPGNTTQERAMQLDLPRTKHVAIQMRISQLVDPLTGQRYSSSGVIKRIRGDIPQK